MHYLIVEDDLDICLILKEILQLLHPQSTVTSFFNGNQAWQWLDKVESGEIKELPNIAFLDIRMPGPQGHEIAERIRKLKEIKNVGIIMMTAYDLSEEEYKEVMDRSQADRYISKPLPGVKGLNQMVDEIMVLRQSLAK